MAKDYMKRINALRENYMSHRVEMDILDAYYVTQGFKATEGQPWQIQKATAMKTVYENKPIFIQDNELLVGGVAFKPRAGILNPDSACSVIEKELDTISTRKYDPFYLSDENKKLKPALDKIFRPRINGIPYNPYPELLRQKHKQKNGKTQSENDGYRPYDAHNVYSELFGKPLFKFRRLAFSVNVCRTHQNSRT